MRFKDTCSTASQGLEQFTTYTVAIRPQLFDATPWSLKFSSGMQAALDKNTQLILPLLAWQLACTGGCRACSIPFRHQLQHGRFSKPKKRLLSTRSLSLLATSVHYRSVPFESLSGPSYLSLKANHGRHEACGQPVCLDHAEQLLFP